jgi:adenylate cyclase
MEQVLSSADLRALQSTRREVTVLFADIRRFTAFAERYPPESVVDVLNQYLEVMVQAVFNHQGTLDKFLGDGLLAIFGTPLQQPDHPQRAVQTALEIQQAIAALNATRHAVNAPALTIGIGINSGEAIVGNIGSEKRMEYTVVGDMVNVAQRLQGQARGGEIIISAPVLAHVHSLVTVYDSLEAQVRGRRQPVLAHRIGPLGS